MESAAVCPVAQHGRDVQCWQGTTAVEVRAGHVTGTLSVPALYRQLAEQHAVPADVVYALALTESRTGLRSGTRAPWPWTLNVRGTAHRFRSRAQAYAALQRWLTRGETRIDVGLMQLHWHYHSDRFASPWDALDPQTNLQAGISLLASLLAERGNLADAVGAYHAPYHSDRANQYRARVEQQLGRAL